MSGDIVNADPDHLEELADLLCAVGDGGVYGQFVDILNRARNLGASDDLASLQSLLDWLMDAAGQLRDGAAILREETPGPSMNAPTSISDPSAIEDLQGDDAEDGEWEFEVFGKANADDFIALARQDDLSDDELERMHGYMSGFEDNPDFAAYLLDQIGMEGYLELTDRVQESDFSDSQEGQSLLDLMGTALSSSLWVPGDMPVGSAEYNRWIENTDLGRAYQARLDAFHSAGAGQVGSGEEIRQGFDVALDLLERSNVPMDDQFLFGALNRLTEPFAPGTDVCVAWTEDVPNRLLDIATGDNPQETLDWWNGLGPDGRESLIAMSPAQIGYMDGIPAEVRDQVNRQYLPTLIEELEGRDDADSQRKLAGLIAIQERLAEETDPPMYLLGIGDEGNGRAIISFGNPDTAENVSAYVPGLDTRLDENFAGGTVDRALHTAQTARRVDPSSDTASIVWLGYDAPVIGDGANFMPVDDDGWGLPEKLDVMSDEHAREGAPAYQQFLEGINVTNQHGDPHVTAIGHSYGSLTMATATQEPGGANADDIVILGSPGVGVDHAEDLGVGADHVFVGAADNDVVTRMPSQEEAALGGAGGLLGGLALGPAGAFLGGDLGGRLADWNDNEIWFGRDPASESFGAQRFAVDDGLPVTEGGFDAHSNYFNPEVDPESAENIAQIVTGNADRISREEYR
jgi:alpha/beta hydrolase family protein